MTNTIETAMFKMLEARTALKETLEKTRKELELAETDYDHSSWYVNMLEDKWNESKDEAIGLKLDKAYEDHQITVESYNELLDKVTVIEETIEELYSLEDNLYYFT